MQGQKSKSHRVRWLFDCIRGRGERIRTSDFYLPKVALYQAELHPDYEGPATLIGMRRWRIEGASRA